MRLCAAAALLTAAGLSIGAASAAELGTLSVSSRLNEPLAAKLTVNDVNEASQPLVLQLASDAVYAKVGRQPVPADLGVKLTLASRNPWVVSITSEKPVTVEDMPIIVEMSEAGKLSAKFYRVKLEKAPAAGATAPKTALVKLPSAQSAAKTASALPSAEKTTAAKTVVKAQTVAKTPVKTVEAKKAAAKPVTGDLYDLDDLSRPVIVRSGMTMWSIAKMYQPRYEGARTEEVLVALVRANPKSFEGGRVTGVKNGARLVPPSEKLVKSVGTDTAWCLVHVTPNADARKNPSAAAMAKAHARMDKQRIVYEKTKPAAKAVPVVKAPEPAAVPAPKPAVEPAEPDNKPVTLPMPTEGVRPVVTEAPLEEKPAEPAAAPVETPAPVVTSEVNVKPKEADLTVTTTTTNIRTEELPKPAEEGGLGWLWALLVVIAAGAGGFFVWRRKKEKEAFERTAQAVRFMRPEPTTAEQVKGMDKLFANRQAADAAAAKGFEKPATSQPDVTAEPRVAVPTATPAAPAAAMPEPSVAAPVPTPMALSEPEAPKAFTIRSSADGTAQFEVAAADEAMKRLEAARAKIAAGLPDEAIPLLKEAELLGNADEKAAAQRLLDTVKRV
mgnify:FL=1